VSSSGACFFFQPSIIAGINLSIGPDNSLHFSRIDNDENGAAAISAPDVCQDPGLVFLLDAVPAGLGLWRE